MWKRTFKVDTSEFFKCLLMIFFTYYLPLPWWKWIIFAGTIVGITLKWEG